jgi:hypothetical protein
METYEWLWALTSGQPYFTEDADWDADDWDSDVSVDDIPAVHPNPPKYLFDSSSDFASRHGNGTEAEFKLEKSAIKIFNRKLRVFYAWPIIILGNDGVSSNWLFLVQTGVDDVMLPKEGETCWMKFPWPKVIYEPKEDQGKRFHRSCRFVLKQAYRVDNPCSQWGVKDDYWERAMAFEVTLPTKTTPFKPIIEPRVAEKGFEDIPRPKDFERHVAFELRVSYSTNGAELSALDRFKEALEATPSQLSSEMIRRRSAFKYLMKFQPQAHFSLFKAFPHLEDPFLRPARVPKELMNMLKGMNSQQEAAFKDGLRRIPDRICFVPGGPGAG